MRLTASSVGDVGCSAQMIEAQDSAINNDASIIAIFIISFSLLTLGFDAYYTELSCVARCLIIDILRWRF